MIVPVVTTGVDTGDGAGCKVAIVGEFDGGFVGILEENLVLDTVGLRVLLKVGA